MNKRPKLEISLKPQILKLYKEGMSCAEIMDVVDVSVTQRTIERLVKRFGLTRTASERFKLAIKKGRIKYKRLGHGKGAKEFRKGISLSLRYATFQRDEFRCTLCGCGAGEKMNLEVDHIVRPIEGGKNSLENLRTLCSACNIGRWHVEQKQLLSKTSDK